MWEGVEGGRTFGVQDQRMAAPCAPAMYLLQGFARENCSQEPLTCRPLHTHHAQLEDEHRITALRTVMATCDGDTYRALRWDVP